MRQFHVDVPLPLSTLETSSPLPSAVCVFGTVMWKSYVALSVGWLLLGNQPIAPIGSLTTKPPPVIRTQPSNEPSGSWIWTGVPE